MASPGPSQLGGPGVPGSGSPSSLLRHPSTEWLPGAGPICHCSPSGTAIALSTSLSQWPWTLVHGAHTLAYTHGHTDYAYASSHSALLLLPYRPLCTSPPTVHTHSSIPTHTHTHTHSCPRSLLLLSGIPPLPPPQSRALDPLESLTKQGLGAGAGGAPDLTRESWEALLTAGLAGPGLPHARTVLGPHCLLCLPRASKPEVTHLSLYHCSQASHVRVLFSLWPSAGRAAQSLWLQPQ